MNGWMDGRMDGRTDGQKDGRTTDGRTGGRIEEASVFCLYLQLFRNELTLIKYADDNVIFF